MAAQQQLSTIHEQNEAKFDTIPNVARDVREKSHIFKYSSGLTVKNNAATHAADDSWLLAYGKDSFSFSKSGVIQYVDYTFKIDQTARGRIYIGIINDNFDFISNPNASNTIETQNMINLENYKIKTGDTIKLRIDILEKELILFYKINSNFKVIKLHDIRQIIDQAKYKFAIKLYHKHDRIKMIDYVPVHKSVYNMLDIDSKVTCINEYTLPALNAKFLHFECEFRSIKRIINTECFAMTRLSRKSINTSRYFMCCHK